MSRVSGFLCYHDFLAHSPTGTLSGSNSMPYVTMARNPLPPIILQSHAGSFVFRDSSSSSKARISRIERRSTDEWTCTWYRLVTHFLPFLILYSFRKFKVD